MVPDEPMMEPEWYRQQLICPIFGDSAFILLILQPSVVGGHANPAAQQAIL